MKVQEWYIQNSVMVNSIVVVYALLLFVSHRNYQSILDHALEIINSDKGRPSDHDLSDQQILKEAIQHGSFFPFIANNLSLIPHRTTENSLSLLTLKDKRWQKIRSEGQN